MADEVMIRFRPLRESDFVHMHRWLNTEHVMEWYSPGGRTYEQVVAKYGPRVRGETAVRCWAICDGEAPIGYIQAYRLADVADHPATPLLTPGENAAAVDLFIGEPAYLNRGLGRQILRAFIREIIFGEFGADSCWIDPDPRNLRAIKAYERAGFRYLTTVPMADGDQQAGYIMRLGREEMAGA